MMQYSIANLVNLPILLLYLFNGTGGAQNTSPVDHMIDIGTHRLQVHIEGEGGPVVVIDAGMADQMDKWLYFQRLLAGNTRVVTYNRAGYGASEAGPLPRHSEREAAELKSLLEKIDIATPFIFVGHSLGALNAQVFASAYPDMVGGLILLDPAPLSFIQGKEYPGLRSMADQLTSEWQAIADAGESSEDEETRRQALFFKTIASEHREMFTETAKQVGSIPGFGNLPLTVMASGRPNPAFGEVAGTFQNYWIEQNRLLAKKSTNGKFVLAEESSHALYQDVPELVADQILDVVRQVRLEDNERITGDSLLRIVSYNVWYGFTQVPERKTAWVEWMREQEADVVFLQELNEYTPEELQSDASEWGHSYSVLLKQEGFPTGITSRYPIEEIKRSIEGFHHGLIRARVNGIYFYNIHLHPSNWSVRNSEIDQVLKDVNQLPPGSQVVLSGDFNTFSPYDSSYYTEEIISFFGKRDEEYSEHNLRDGKLDYSALSKVLENGFTDTEFSSRGDSYIFTGSFPTLIEKPGDHGPLRRLDYIFVNEALEPYVLRAHIIANDTTSVLSDHLPVIAEIRKE